MTNSFNAGDDITLWSATDLAAAVREKRLGCRELLEACLARVERLNPVLNAVVVLDIEQARARAEEADAAIARGNVWGPLHGLPMTVKESFDVEGMPTTWGQPALRDNCPRRSAVAVKRLQKAGAILYGKTNVPLLLSDWQSYNAVYGTTNNPWMLGRTPGGSSGGSAVAVATGMSAVEIGTDIGASIRNPAHYCGVYGHKPSYRIVPLQGHALPGAKGEPDLSVAGPLARSAADLDLFLSIIVGPAGEEAQAWRLELPATDKTRLADFKVGLIYESTVSEIDKSYRRQLEDLAKRLRACGATVVEGARPEFDDLEHHETYIRMLRAVTTAREPETTFERSLVAAGALAADDKTYVAQQVRAAAMHHREWLQWNARRHALREKWSAWFDQFDLLLCPCAASTAFPQDEGRPREERRIPLDNGDADYNDQLFWAGIATLTYLPATVAPIGIDQSGLPAGVQIIGPYVADRLPIAFARALEREVGGYTPPPIVTEPMAEASAHSGGLSPRP